MTENGTISLEAAKDQFTKLMFGLSKTDHENLISFIVQEWPCKVNSSKSIDIIDSCDSAKEEILYDPIDTLNSIVKHIKKRIPFDATFPSETIVHPKTGENSDCDPNVTLHIDAFLYTDDDINKLVEAGQLNRYYCQDCGSRNTKPLIFISHSISRDSLYFIFNQLLPTLKGKTILDVGSRLGAVLYGAYVYTDAERIIGVEMNKELCDLQHDIVYKYKMQDRIEILHKRIEEATEVIKLADVIILNNPFEFYLTETEQINIWQFLKANIKRGTIIVTRPEIEITFENLNTGIQINDWLKRLEQPCINKFSLSQFDIDIDDDDSDDENSNIACYEIL